jgi:hypothetical protein
MYFVFVINKMEFHNKSVKTFRIPVCCQIFRWCLSMCALLPTWNSSYDLKYECVINPRFIGLCVRLGYMSVMSCHVLMFSLCAGLPTM